MELGNNIFYAENYTERTLIESILSSYYIVDYGFIKEVNGDETINVTHAKQLKTLNDETLPATITKNVEVLTIAGAGFSFKFDYKKGDKVLLLGFKDYIKKVEDVTSATETTAYFHYSRDTLKAIPMCVFNGDAKVKVEVKDGDTKLEGSGKLTIDTGDTIKIDTKDKIELNGNSKQFVTWAELNTELQKLMTALNSHVHYVIEEGANTNSPTKLMTLDISSAKTTTVVTGG